MAAIRLMNSYYNVYLIYHSGKKNVTIIICKFVIRCPIELFEFVYLIRTNEVDYKRAYGLYYVIIYTLLMLFYIFVIVFYNNNENIL